MAKNLDSKISDYLKKYISKCPFCGDRFLDKRIKKQRGRIISPLIIRRWTPKSVQLECMKCGLRFTVYWKTFLTMTKIIAKKTKDPEQDQITSVNAEYINDYLKRIRILEYYEKKGKKEAEQEF